MKIRTVDDLSEKLDHEFGWRKKEILDFFSKIENKKKPQKFLVRALICIMYAHWEGFIRASSDLYLNFVNHQKIKKENLSLTILGFSAFKIKGYDDSNNFEKQMTVVTTLLNNTTLCLDIPHDNAIKSGWNLNADRLEEFCIILDIDFTQFALSSNLIDIKLLKARNEIAHGEYNFQEHEDAIETCEKILDMLDLFKNQVINNAVQKKYIKSS